MMMMIDELKLENSIQESFKNPSGIDRRMDPEPLFGLLTSS